MLTSTPYSPAFFSAQQEGSLRSARAIVPLVMSFGGISSVVDFGCGVGPWLKVFGEYGIIDTVGFDGDYIDRSQLLIPLDQFRVVDLAAPLPPVGRMFDLAICLEVAEHLPASQAVGLVERLTATAPRVLFSAAIPFQDGTNHVNPQWPSYWRELFADRGYERLDPIRPRVWQNLEVEWWYKQNTYLFCDRNLIAKDSLLRAEAERSAACPFELVFHEVYKPLTKRKSLLRSIVGSVRYAASRVFRHGSRPHSSKQVQVSPDDKEASIGSSVR